MWWSSPREQGKTELRAPLNNENVSHHFLVCIDVAQTANGPEFLLNMNLRGFREFHLHVLS